MRNGTLQLQSRNGRLDLFQFFLCSKEARMSIFLAQYHMADGGSLSSLHPTQPMTHGLLQNRNLLRNLVLPDLGSDLTTPTDVTVQGRTPAAARHRHHQNTPPTTRQSNWHEQRLAHRSLDASIASYSTCCAPPASRPVLFSQLGAFTSHWHRPYILLPPWQRKASKP